MREPSSLIDSRIGLLCLSEISRHGSFNIDIKNVAVGVVLSLNDSDDDGEVEIGHFEIGINWRDLSFQFERVAGRFTTVANLFINQVRINVDIHFLPDLRIGRLLQSTSPASFCSIFRNVCAL